MSKDVREYGSGSVIEILHTIYTYVWFLVIYVILAKTSAQRVNCHIGLTDGASYFQRLLRALTERDGCRIKLPDNESMGDQWFPL